MSMLTMTPDISSTRKLTLQSKVFTDWRNLFFNFLYRLKNPRWEGYDKVIWAWNPHQRKNKALKRENDIGRVKGNQETSE